MHCLLVNIEQLDSWDVCGSRLCICRVWGTIPSDTEGSVCMYRTVKVMVLPEIININTNAAFYYWYFHLIWKRFRSLSSCVSSYNFMSYFFLTLTSSISSGKNLKQKLLWVIISCTILTRSIIVKVRRHISKFNLFCGCSHEQHMLIEWLLIIA